MAHHHCFLRLGRGGLPGDLSSASEELGEAIRPNDSDNYAPPIQEEKNRGVPAAGARDGHHSEMGETDEDPDDLDLDGEESQEDDEFSVELGNGVRIKKVKDPHGGYITLEESVDAGNNSTAGIGFKYESSRDGRTICSLGWDKARNLDNSSLAPSVSSHTVSAYIDRGTQDKQSNKSDACAINTVANISSSGEGKREIDRVVAESEEKKPLLSGVTMPNCKLDHVVEKRKRGKNAAVTISKMYQILLKNRRSFCSMIPGWSSPSDGQILEAKRQIANAPIADNDTELYSPIFRNVSMFKRSFELMEKMLKVYIYKEGQQPIFH